MTLLGKFLLADDASVEGKGEGEHCFRVTLGLMTMGEGLSLQREDGISEFCRWMARWLRSWYES